MHRWAYLGPFLYFCDFDFLTSTVFQHWYCSLPCLVQVVDSADRMRLDVCKAELQGLLQEEVATQPSDAHLSMLSSSLILFFDDRDLLVHRC